MKVDVEKKLVQINGEVLLDAKDGKAVPVILKNILVNAILLPKEKESGVDKVRKYELAKLIYTGGEVDLGAEDITLIKACVGEGYAPLIVGQVFEILK